MPVQKRAKAKAAPKSARKAATKTTPKSTLKSKSDSKVRAAGAGTSAPLARVRDQAKEVHGKVKKARVNLSGVNKVLKEETKSGATPAAVVEAVKKSGAVEAKVEEAANELAVVHEALSVENDARQLIEEELELTQEALSESLEQVKHARHASLHDHVTGLPNAALFRDRLKSALAQARRHTWRIAVMFIDLDDFKQINDTHGHDAGDALLVFVAERLSGFVRGGDTVSRRSGDEFLVLMLEAKDEDNARAMSQKIIEDIGRPVLLGGVELSVSASVGLAMFPEDGTTAKVLLKNADLAMYEAKARLKATRIAQ